jgi:hypothetical protein
VDVEGAAAEALDGRQDIVGRVGPAERLRACVLLTDERLDDLGTLRIGARDLALHLILLAFRPISPESLIRSIESCRARVARKFRNGTLGHFLYRNPLRERFRALFCSQISIPRALCFCCRQNIFCENPLQPYASFAERSKCELHELGRLLRRVTSMTTSCLGGR